MKLENQVVSLDLAKRLKELGVPQESLFLWSEHTIPATLWSETQLIKRYNGQRLPNYPHAAAFTVAELGEMLLGYDLPYYEDGEWRSGGYRNLPTGRQRITADTEADCRAAELIYRIENKLITLS